jgi:group I intron endonuclease
LNNLHIRTTVLSYRNLLNQKSGVYAFINLINGKRYIGSGINLYRRFLDHIVGRSSNILLQRAFQKYGLNNFEFVIYAYSDYDLSLIIDLENKFISSFPFTMLYNLTPAAGSMFGYKHSAESIIKMEERFKDKNNHPMFGKTHSIEAKELISKPGALNPMFGKNHTIETREKMSNSKSTPVTLYNHNNQYILTFKNSIQLANFLNCNKSTIGRYLKSGKCFKGLYYFKTN